LDEQSGHHNEKASRPLFDPKADMRPPASLNWAIASRAAHLILRFGAVWPGQRNGKSDLDGCFLRLQQIDTKRQAPRLS